MPKFSPPHADVTMFQPARPREMWSSDAIWRATLYGWLNDVDTEPMRPMWLVRAASADSRVTGSRPGSGWFGSVETPSARKIVWIFAASAAAVRSAYRSRSTTSSARLCGFRQVRATPPSRRPRRRPPPRSVLVMGSPSGRGTTAHGSIEGCRG